MHGQLFLICNLNLIVGLFILQKNIFNGEKVKRVDRTSKRV